MVDLFSVSIFDSKVLNESLEELKDEELVMLAKKGNAKAISILINKYKNFVRSRSKSYFIVGADREDIIQEGLIGLFKAIRDYNPDKKTSFRAFAKLCIIKHLIKTLRNYNRQKHLTLHISLDKPLDNIELMSNTDIEKELIANEIIDIIKEKIKEKLSDLENKIFEYYLNNMNYKEIAKVINKDIKVVDNALKRIKNKIKDVEV
jgi:RNA polymerase sporulation-specific sigma factor